MAPAHDSPSSTQDSLSDPDLDLSDLDLKTAIHQHFASLVLTQDTQPTGVPVGWSAGQWNARTWADGGMEAGITQLFVDLGLESKMTAMKHLGLNTFWRTRTEDFWLPVWKFRLDRDAKNGSLALSTRNV
jgi:hypothetical protein